MARGRRNRARRLLFAGILSLAAQGAQGPLTAQATSVVAEYERGDYASASRRPLGTVAALRSLRRDVQQATLVNVRARAAFLLEATHLAHMQMYRWPTAQVLAIRDLLEDACGLVKTLAPTDPFVRQWHLAALSVVSQSHDVRLIEHLAHSREHLGDGPVILARAIHDESDVWHGIYQTAPSLKGDLPNPGVDFRLAALSRARMSDATRRVNDLFREAAKYPEVRPEALLRLAALADASGASEQAIKMFDEVESLTKDDWLLYLARLLKGRAQSSLRRNAEAESSFRDAIALRPNARSANLALASLLYSRGDPALDVLAAALKSGVDEPDPWAQYENGDFRFWPSRVASMRESMR